MSTDDLLLRPATVEDAPAMGDIHVDSRNANVGSIPPMVHSREDTHGWVRGRLAADSSGWVAERAGRPVGYLVVTGNWVDDLYLAPGETGQGIGTALLDVAKAERPDGFFLWAFVSNEGARRFYRRHGLVELEQTDGSSNEEKAPDVRMAWPGHDPVGFLRRCIDDVDDELGDLLARRAALTRAVQAYKDGRTRDPQREQDIVRRLAARVPELGEERLTRIMHAIITESLDAVGRGTTEQEVVAAATERAVALASGDAVALAELLHPRFSWTSHRGEAFDRSAYLDNNTGGRTVWDRQELGDPEVVVVGDVAVLRAVVTDVVAGDAGSEMFRMPVTQVWVRGVEGWQCLAGHAGPIDEG